MKWSDQAWETVNSVYEQIIAMPFNQELSDGTLSPDKFVFYLAQDAFYLLEFGKALSAISSRLKSADQVLAFANFSSGAILAERALHESYFVELGLPHEIVATPTTLLYTNYLLNQAAYANVEVAAAAVLPCFWIYKKVGDYIFSIQKGSNNPYKRWIDMYAGEAFAKSVKLAIDITDELAEKAGKQTRIDMITAFEQATKLEWMFWDSAYNLEKWKI
ncbi:TenA family protein [Pedobacter rhizosphaerae]|uniref:Thiaminase /4-amino-5-aminomethyl-2-methylpyrimidine deaminase n=1 Tax=Pedobacter rhizosphaerae TaxID=390241 RepID=A0A1H9V873_9SPHI|nr:TenA family protein [Pedobacter rhizosphaerae]SES17731.1 thiaminase /4-amino-5-aminomethyl-2-methylpyrimidine deaminase [Pedobacter rhizosphaerae]